MIHYIQHIHEAIINPMVLLAGAQLAKAGVDAYRANQFRKAKRPTRTTDANILKNQEIANNAYGAASTYGLPGQGQIENKLNAQTAGAANNIANSQQNPNSMLAGYAALDQNSKNSMADLGVKAANYRAGQMNATRAGVYNANSQVANENMKNWDWNQKSPYLASQAAASAFGHSANQGLWGGLQTLAGSGVLDGAGGVGSGGGGNPTAGANGMGGNPMLMNGLQQGFGGRAPQRSAWGGVVSPEQSSMIQRLRTSPEYRHLNDNQFYHNFYGTSGQQDMPFNYTGNNANNFSYE